jgi:hypothetical protein
VSVLANDTFTGASATALASHTTDDGHAWVRHPGDVSAGNGAAISNANRMRGSSSGVQVAVFYVDSVPGSADEYAEVDYVSIDTGTNLAALLLRWDTAALTGYAFQIGQDGVYRLQRWAAGVSTQITSFATGAFTAGETRRIRAEATGTVLNLYVGGVLAKTFDDTVNAIAAAGRAGVRMRNATDTTGLHFDNFTAGDSVVSGHTLAVGQATETSTAQAVGRIKVRTLGQPVATNTAQGIVRLKRRAIGQALEADTAQGITRAVATPDVDLPTTLALAGHATSQTIAARVTTLALASHPTTMVVADHPKTLSLDG